MSIITTLQSLTSPQAAPAPLPVPPLPSSGHQLGSSLGDQKRQLTLDEVRKRRVNKLMLAEVPAEPEPEDSEDLAASEAADEADLFEGVNEYKGDDFVVMDENDEELVENNPEPEVKRADNVARPDDLDIPPPLPTTAPPPPPPQAISIRPPPRLPVTQQPPPMPLTPIPLEAPADTKAIGRAYQDALRDLKEQLEAQYNPPATHITRKRTLDQYAKDANDAIKKLRALVPSFAYIPEVKVELKLPKDSKALHKIIDQDDPYIQKNEVNIKKGIDYHKNALDQLGAATLSVSKAINNITDSGRRKWVARRLKAHIETTKGLV